jgi:hypothetical protein
MAISTHRVTINPQDLSSYTKEDVLTQLEDGISWLGWHGDSLSGLVCGVTSFTGGGSITDETVFNYEDVYPIATTGIGTGASFFVARGKGEVGYVVANRPGKNYVPGDTVTLSAEDIGGSANGATDITVRLTIAGEATGGLGYGITLTGTYESEGTDRNGFVTGNDATITIKEGDTLTLENYMSSSSYEVNIIQSGAHFSKNYRPQTASDYKVGYYDGLIHNVIGNNNSSSNSGGITRFKPLPGQRGTYFVVDNGGDFSTFTPKIVVQPATSGITTFSYGSTASYYAKDTSGSYPWACWRHVVQDNKKFGDTYRVFGMVNSTQYITTWAGSGFFPASFNSTDTNSYLYGSGHARNFRLAGLENADISAFDIFEEQSSPEDSMTGFEYISQGSRTSTAYKIDTGGSTSRQLDLNIFKSGIDPRFAVFSYTKPTQSATKLRDRTFGTFFFHNFESTIWDYDDQFLSGLTHIIPSDDDNRAGLTFRTFLNGTSYYYGTSNKRYPAKRSAEFGYSTVDDSNSDSPSEHYHDSWIDTFYQTNTDNETVNPGTVKIYYRDSTARGRSYTNQSGYAINRLSSDLDFNAVIKGIPLNARIMPVPYYIPDDFVLIDFYYNVSGVNIQQGDTISISGSEQYTVIQGSYRQTGGTYGVLFCGRVV